jgi:hypothetical protein
MGSPLAHPWRGVVRDTVLNIDLNSHPRDARTSRRRAPVASFSEPQKLASLLRQPDQSDFWRTDAMLRMPHMSQPRRHFEGDTLRNGVWLACGLG